MVFTKLNPEALMHDRDHQQAEYPGTDLQIAADETRDTDTTTTSGSISTVCTEKYKYFNWTIFRATEVWVGASLLHGERGWQRELRPGSVADSVFLRTPENR